MDNVKCLIMAGGAGTRFWPQSTKAKPKQYLNILGNDSLIQSTIKRFNRFVDFKDILVVSAKDQSKILEQQAENLPSKNFIYEPIGKNTLPAIGLAAMFAEKENPEAIMLVSPADHLIKDEKLFEDTIHTAVQLSHEKQGIVMIGITPRYPATGYGYIQSKNKINNSNLINQFEVNQFVEKPPIDIAKKYLADGSFYWNSGMFIFPIKSFLKDVSKFQPKLFKGLKEIQSYIGKSNYDEKLLDIYGEFEKVSVDYGIMEHAENIYMVEGNFEWNDLGSWKSVYQEAEKDRNANVVSEGVVVVNSKNSYIHTDDGVVAVVGLDNVVVVKEGDKLLICHKDKTEDVKKVVEQLKQNNRSKYL